MHEQRLLNLSALGFAFPGTEFRSMDFYGFRGFLQKHVGEEWSFGLPGGAWAAFLRSRKSRPRVHRWSLVMVMQTSAHCVAGLFDVSMSPDAPIKRAVLRLEPLDHERSQCELMTFVSLVNKFEVLQNRRDIS